MFCPANRRDGSPKDTLLNIESTGEFVVVGEGPQRDALKGLAARWGLRDCVHFLGRRDDVWGLLRGCTVCALPSRSEGISNTLLEALAAGAPVVSFRRMQRWSSMSNSSASSRRSFEL